MLQFSALRDFTREGLAQPRLIIEPGPDLPDVPNQFVVLTAVPGGLLDTEYLYDNVGYQVLVVGKQNDYDDAETLALAIDKLYLSIQGQKVGGGNITHVVRFGGQPSPLLKDEADRWQFVCTYSFHVQSALARQ